MKPNLIVWDLETVPNLGGFAATNDLVGKSDVEVRAAIGNKGALFIVGHLLEDSRLFPRSDRGNKPCVPQHLRRGAGIYGDGVSELAGRSRLLGHLRAVRRCGRRCKHRCVAREKD